MDRSAKIPDISCLLQLTQMKLFKLMCDRYNGGLSNKSFSFISACDASTPCSAN